MRRPSVNNGRGSNAALPRYFRDGPWTRARKSTRIAAVGPTLGVFSGVSVAREPAQFQLQAHPMQDVTGAVIDRDAVMPASVEQFACPSERLMLAREFFRRDRMPYWISRNVRHLGVNNPIRHYPFPNELHEPRGERENAACSFQVRDIAAKQSASEISDPDRVKSYEIVCGTDVAF